MQAEVANQGVSGIDELAELDAQDISDMAIAINKMQNAANPNIRFGIIAIKKPRQQVHVDERDEMMIWCKETNSPDKSKEDGLDKP
eukprot:3573621-Ditylum_brightwellii.AAC.1